MALAQLSAAAHAQGRTLPRKPKVGAMVDEHVAIRLKAARIAAGLTQESAAAHINLTFQQLQKYEKATNRISAGKLAILARLYGKPVAWFFEGAPSVVGSKDIPPLRDLVGEMFTAFHGREVMENYLALPLPLQMTVSRLAADLADSKQED